MTKRKVYMTDGMRKVLIDLFACRYMSRKDLDLTDEETDCAERLGIFKDLP